MNLAQLSVHLAIPLPKMFAIADDSNYLDDFYSTLEEIVDFSGSFQIPFFGWGTICPEIKWVKNEFELRQMENIFPSAVMTECEHLIFSIDVPHEDEKDADLFIPSILIKRLTDFIIMANLCHIGSIELETSEMIQNGILQVGRCLPKMDGLSIQSALIYSGNSNWPNLRTLRLIDAWEWLLHQDIYLEMEGFENDPTSRAINAYSRLFETSTEDLTMHLVWAMVGIEALYVRGKENIMQQVREKVPTVLGKNEIFKKNFKKMYEFRSRFIHGDMDFPGIYHLGDASPGYEKYYDDQIETVDFAVAILLASLQQIIMGNWNVPD